jgi:hypothetical protein
MIRQNWVWEPFKQVQILQLVNFPLFTPWRDAGREEVLLPKFLTSALFGSSGQDSLISIETHHGLDDLGFKPQREGDFSHPFTKHPLPTQPPAQGVLFPFPGAKVAQWRTQEFCWGGGLSTNSVEDRGQRERGTGSGSPLVRGSVGSCNMVQEVSFHIFLVFGT